MGSGQLRGPSGTRTQTLRPSSGVDRSRSRTNAWMSPVPSTSAGPPISAAPGAGGPAVCAIFHPSPVGRCRPPRGCLPRPVTKLYAHDRGDQAVSPRLSRASASGRAAAPVRLVHLGLGSFFRAHTCWYTEHAADAAGWGIAAFTGRGNHALVRALGEQDGLYTVISRGSEADAFEVIGCLVRAHPAADHQAWLRYFEAPELAAVTITVTEAGYFRGD